MNEVGRLGRNEGVAAVGGDLDPLGLFAGLEMGDDLPGFGIEYARLGIIFV